MNKMYRIIKPTQEPHGHCNWKIEDNTLLISVWDNYVEESEWVTIGEIGEIITFKRIEDLINKGLHPIYFTEEVILDPDSTRNYLSIKNWMEAAIMQSKTVDLLIKKIKELETNND